MVNVNGFISSSLCQSLALNEWSALISIWIFTILHWPPDGRRFVKSVQYIYQEYIFTSLFSYTHMLTPLSSSSSPPTLCWVDTGSTLIAVAPTASASELSRASEAFPSLHQRSYAEGRGGAGCSKISALLQEPGTGHKSCHEHTYRHGSFPLAWGATLSALLGRAGKERARARSR